MQFNNSRPIYLQIADYIFEKILTEGWETDGRISSVRDLAIELEVNPNTVMRTYEYLQQEGIVYNQRGLGLFVHTEAGKKIMQLKKEHFLEHELPRFFREMYLLNLDIKDLEKKYYKFVRQNFPHEKK
jgi:DNA-binding transcriptional regulator YhcF (GntR family)